LENVNHGFANLVGMNEPDLIGKKIQDFVYPADLHFLPFNNTSVSESLRKYDLRFMNQNGDILYANVIERYKHELGTSDSFQIIARDITQRIQVEQLEKEKSVAERANVVKSQFLANMSHEIRTPLHGVLSALDILNHDIPIHEQKQFIEIAKSSGSMLLELVNGVLDYSKIEAGKLELSMVYMSVEKTVYDVINIIKEKVNQKQINLKINVPHLSKDHYYGDATRIRQILLNLLGNAVKFTEKGEIALSVTVLNDSPEMTLFRFEVKDTGIGISPENVKTVFDIFSQVDSGYTRLYGGTGLGLAISKELVHLMKGEIGVESKLGTGSAFWIEIPIAKDDTMSAVSLQ
jgi:PAS domain S-box-containing protein